MEYNEERYKIALKNCELGTVINALPGGDLTEIGENGISLSGGQRQRVQIARAVYADADIYIIDSPLSALDYEKGARILKNVLLGLLGSKTRIMCTQNMRTLRYFDIIYMMDGGRIETFGNLKFIKYHNSFINLFTEEGVFKEKEYLKATREATIITATPTDTILSFNLNEEERENDNIEDRNSCLSYRQSVHPLRESKRRMVRQMLEEDQQTGLISYKVYLFYLRNIGGFNLIVVCILYGSYSFVAFRINYIMGQWP